MSKPDRAADAPRGRRGRRATLTVVDDPGVGLTFDPPVPLYTTHTCTVPPGSAIHYNGRFVGVVAGPVALPHGITFVPGVTDALTSPPEDAP